MAVALSLDASAGSSARDHVARWVVPGLLALPAASIAWSIGGNARLDAGVAIAALVLGGWRGFAVAIFGAALIDFVLAPDRASAIAWVIITLVTGLVGGVALRRVLVQRQYIGISHPLPLLLWTGLAALVASVFVAAVERRVVPLDLLHLMASVWAGALLAAPLVLEVFEESDRKLGPPLAILIGFIALAIVVSIAAPLLAQAAMPVVIGAALLGLVALLAAQRAHLTLASALACVAGVAAFASLAVPVAVRLAILVGVPLVLAVGLADRQMRRLRAAQAVNQSLFDAMMRFIPVGIVRVGLDGVLRYANPMFQTLTGLSAPEPGDWLEAIHPDDRARIAQAWEKFRRGSTAFDEALRVTPLSNLRWIEVRISTEYDAGNAIGYIGTVTDITTQRRSEDARNRSEAFARAILESTVDAIATIDESGTVLTFNRAAQAMFGYSPDEVIGRNVNILMPEPHRSLHDTYVSAYRTTGQARIIGIGRELEGRRKDGSLLPIYLAVSEVFVEGRRTFSGIMRDITREKQSQEEIRRQNERLTVTVRNAPMGIVTYRFGETFASTNQAFETMLGYQNDELVRLDLAALTHPEDRDELTRMTAEAQQGRSEQQSLQVRLLKKDGTPVHVIVHTAMTHDQRGAPDLVIAQVEDLTAEMHAKESERVQQDRLTHVARLSTLGEMTAGIAHEINQPLTAISMYAQSSVRMLDAGIPKPERLREALEKLTAQSLRAGAVIDRIQRLVRREESLFEAVDINELINDILRLAESDARVNDIQIELDLAEDLPLVNADPVQIQQVLLNLVRNGIDAMRSVNCSNGSMITVTTRPLDRNTVSVAVTDLGTGVPADFAPELFTPFATTKHNGMGMGLSICRSIIEAHGGHLGYRNNTDCGATFYFHLPVGHFHEDT